ncbi:MAG TPA: hypothetical protein VLJ79_19460 [Candidatus Binatia bacterium]|nr:hypothetical protein [Candidatus Binatia bacterium]
MDQEKTPDPFSPAPVSSYKPLFLLTILFSVGLLCVYRSIGEQHVPRKAEKKISKQTGVFVTKVSILGMVEPLLYFPTLFPLKK